MNCLRPRNLLLPLLLLSAVVTFVGGLSAGFRYSSRWVLVGIVTLHVLTARRAIRGGTAFLLAVAAFVLWCLLTTVWSEVPLLSAAKAGALALVAFAGLWGGYLWIVNHDRRHAFAFLGLSTVLIVTVGLSSGGAYQAGEWALHAGATGNPNFLGTTVALCLPLVLWRLYEARRDPRVRLFWGGAFVLLLSLVYLALSRGGYVIVVCTLLGFLASHRLRTFVYTVAFVASLGLGCSIVAPDATSEWVRRNIYKSRGAELGVLFARERVWEESWTAAIEGGRTGVGFGVSVGSDPGALGSLVTTTGYGREKGSSQLAIAEETGTVGLCLYAILASTLFVTLVRAFSRAAGDTRSQLGILIGTLVGMMIQSTVEAWWVAPGSPEAIFFWVFAGAALGLAGPTHATARRAARLRSSAAPVPA